MTHGFSQVNSGDILSLRAGIYRMTEEPGSNTINTDHLTLRSHNGELAQIYGSASTEDKTWQAYNANVWIS